MPVPFPLVYILPRMSRRQDLPLEAIVDVRRLRVVETALQLQQGSPEVIEDIHATRKSSKVSPTVVHSGAETLAGTKLHTRAER